MPSDLQEQSEMPSCGPNFGAYSAWARSSACRRADLPTAVAPHPRVRVAVDERSGVPEPDPPGRKIQTWTDPPRLRPPGPRGQDSGRSHPPARRQLGRSVRGAVHRVTIPRPSTAALSVSEPVPEVISSRRGFTPARSRAGAQGTPSRLVPRPSTWLPSRRAVRRSPPAAPPPISERCRVWAEPT